MSISSPRARSSLCIPARGTCLRSLNSSAGLFSIHRSANPCKNPRHDVSNPLHERSSCPQTGARHEEHRPPGFPAFHAYGVQ